MDSAKISVQTVNHLGIIAGLVDEIGIVEQIDEFLGRHPKEVVSAGLVVKAMIINGLGIVAAPLYLFERFFEGKATEHLIGSGVRAEHLNDDRLGRVLDQLYLAGLTRLFVSIALKAAAQFGVATNTLHLDSSSFHVHGEYEANSTEVSFVGGKPGRPRKDAQPQVNYRLQATLALHQEGVQNAIASSGRFVLATNVTDSEFLTAEQVLFEYKAQQSPERGFRFLKDPLFFTNSVFVKSPERVAAIAFVMGLCLLVYNLGQRALRHALVEAGETIPNQLGQATQRPTLRWVFQCFQDVHLLLVTGVKQIANLTEERLWILRFFSRACRQYYLLI